MNRDAAHFGVDDFALTSMESYPHLKPQPANLIADGTRASDRPRRAIEGGKYAVARRIDLAPAKSFQFPTDRGEVPFQGLAPAAVTELGRTLGRAYDVSEHDRNQQPIWLWPVSGARHELFHLVDQAIQHLGLEGLQQMVVTRQLDIFGAGNVLREIPPSNDRDSLVADTMQDQRRSLN